MSSLRQIIRENIRRKVIEPLKRGEELHTLSFYRGVHSHKENKRRDRIGRRVMERLRKKGLIRYSPVSGEYSYRHPKQGEAPEAREKSYVLRPGDHPKAKRFFHKITKALAKRGGQESIGIFRKEKRKRRASGHLEYTSGESKGKVEKLGRVYYNTPKVRGQGRSVMLKGNPQTSFTARKRKYRLRKKSKE